EQPRRLFSGRAAEDSRPRLSAEPWQMGCRVVLSVMIVVGKSGIDRRHTLASVNSRDGYSPGY
ncbi:MAG: hypothetical protein AAF236_17925, partial [Verrucomicrobiota bacterium]